MDRRATTAHRSGCCALAPQGTRFQIAYGHGIFLYRFGLLPERRSHERLVGVEFLSYGIADGCWAVVRLRGLGGNDYSPGHRVGRIVEPSTRSDIFRIFSRHPIVWRGNRRFLHGPLHRGSRGIALQSPRPARAKRDLDYGRQPAANDRGTLFEIIRLGGCHRPSRHAAGWPASSSGVRADFYRWISFGGLGLRGCASARRLLTESAAELS